MTPVSRRLFWPVVPSVVLVVVLALLASNATPPARLHAQDAATITIGVTDLPSTLDPGEAYDFSAWEVLGHLYTGLTRQVPGTLDYELALAADVTVSEDRLTYTFTLQPDAAFTDGTPITAQTFVDSITRVQALNREAAQAVNPYVESVSVAPQGELVFRLKRPVPYFLALVALPPYFPQHPRLVATDRPEPFAAQLIGNGPYLLDRFEVRQQIVLKANPAYSYGPPPVTPTIILKRYDKSRDLREALQNHEIDLAWRALFLGDLLEVQEIEGLTVMDVPTTRVFYLYMNHDLEPFDDPLVRQAVTLLLERETVVSEVFQGYATVLTSLVPDLFPDAADPIWPDMPDVTLAEEILRAAAYSPRGQGRLAFTIVTSQPTYGDLYLSAAVELSRASFRSTQFIESGAYGDVDTSTLLRTLERGEGRLILFGWTPIVPHPDAYLRPLAHSAEPIPARGRYAKPEVDALLDQAAALGNPAEQGALYREAAAWLLDGYDIAPVWQEHTQVVAWDDITGIRVEPNFFLHYDQLARRTATNN